MRIGKAILLALSQTEFLKFTKNTGDDELRRVGDEVKLETTFLRTLG